MSLGVFDSKFFNAEVFKGYVDRLPNPKKNELIKSKAIRPRPDLAQAMKDGDGGNYLTTSLKGLINNSAAQNYDGSTDLQTNKTTTFKHSRVVVGRMNAWTENDFSYDITGGQDFLENVAEQLVEYFEEIDQATLVAILTGIFNMTGDANAAFVEAHTHDVTGVSNSEGQIGRMDGTTLNTAMQRACGDNKGKFSLALMHSFVATNLENLKILVYLKYNDGNGIEREIGLATLNGRLVLVDDSMPVINVPAQEAIAAVDAVDAVQGVYTISVTGAAIEGDKLAISFGGETFEYVADGAATAAAVAKTVRDVLKTKAAFTNVFTVGGNGSSITFTQKVGGTGAIPTVTATQTTNGTIAASIATTTAGVAAVAGVPAVEAKDAYKKYVTFVLGDGAIEYTDCGAKVPYETDRNPYINGGQDSLIARQRKCYAPFGISFTMESMSTLSPSDEELAMGVNWELVHSADQGGATQYINHKSIPIARIISLG